MNRRKFIACSTAAASLGAISGVNAQAQTTPGNAKSGARQGNPIAVSTYSFWHFLEETVKIDDCVNLAAEMGFDAVEILEVQMHTREPAYLRKIKWQCLTSGLALCGLSTHQGFVSPDADNSAKRTSKKPSPASSWPYELGIPTIRVNTGRWGTSKDFDDLMAHRGIEPPLPGYKEEDGFPWVIESLEKCLPTAEKCGVVLGLENHWGLARTPEGLLKIYHAVNSPWLGVTVDTGNFLEDPYDRLEKIAPLATFVQAKTYYGGGVWYTLDLNYQRIGEMFRKLGYRGYVSLEYEGKEDPKTAIPKSLALLRKSFVYS